VIVLARIVLRLLADMAGLIALSLRRQRSVVAENLFLRRQLSLYHERGVRPRRVEAATRVSLAVLSRLFDWRDALVVVRPETMIRWHRAGWRLFWRIKSRPGRPPIPLELRQLIRRMATENPIWGEERIANELLLKLIHRDDPHEVLWGAYDEAVTALRTLSRRAIGVPGLLAAEPGLGVPRAVEPVLRRFELAMMRELGYALELGRDAVNGAPIDPGREYWYVVERGPVPCEGGGERADAVKLSGLTLIDLDRGRFDDARTVSQAKSLMRMLIHHCLNGQELATRAIIRDLQRLEGAA
jgi:hypothetical protein